MRFVVTTEQVVVRRYVVEAPGPCRARDMVEAEPHQYEQEMRWQEARPERVTCTEKEDPWRT